MCRTLWEVEKYEPSLKPLEDESSTCAFAFVSCHRSSFFVCVCSTLYPSAPHHPQTSAELKKNPPKTEPVWPGWWGRGVYWRKFCRSAQASAWSWPKLKYATVQCLDTQVNAVCAVPLRENYFYAEGYRSEWPQGWREKNHLHLNCPWSSPAERKLTVWIVYFILFPVPSPYRLFAVGSRLLSSTFKR